MDMVNLLFYKGSQTDIPGIKPLDLLHCSILTCQVGLGLTYLSHSDDILAGMVAQKQTFIGSAENPVTLKLKAQADFHAQTSQACHALPLPQMLCEVVLSCIS